jgi:hypothetical protein
VDPARRWILLVALFALHNAEEVFLDLPGWARTHVGWLRGLEFSQGDMALAVLALTGAIAAWAFAVRRNLELTILSQQWFLTLVSAVFVWHMAVSIWAGSFQPGVWTSMAFLPVFLRMLATMAVERRRI